MGKIMRFVNGVKEFVSGIGERKLSVYAASGCYFMFMSLVPLVMILCCILPYTPFSQELVFSYIDQYMAEQVAKILRGIVAAVYASSGATLTVSILLTIFSASKSMKAVMNGMDAAYNCKKKRNGIIFTVESLIYMVLMMLAILVALFVMVYGGEILNLLTRYLPNLELIATVITVLRFLIPFVVFAVFFALLYMVTPAEKKSFRKQIPGAVFTSVVWVSFSYIFSLYVSISDKFGAYGYIGSVMVAMMWINYCLMFLLIGGYINSFIMEKTRKD